MASTVVEKDMYNGRYHIVHNPDARGSQPRYVVTNNRTGDSFAPQGVTTILGATLAKDFVGWALDCMEQYLLNLPAGDIPPEAIAEAKLEATRRRDSGASTGSEAHALIEHYLKHEDVEMSKVSAEALNAFGAFMVWIKENTPGVLGSEEVIYSPRFRYAGTFDALMELDGKVYIVDFKTTNVSRKAPQGIYPEYFIQLGAYAAALREEHPDQQLDGLMVVSVRKDGKLDTKTNEDLGLSVRECENMWVRVRNLASFLDNVSQELKPKEAVNG